MAEVGETQNRGPPQAGVDGNWACPACRNVNYRSRESCNRCHEPKPIDPNANWMCPKCNNDNYPFRMSCNRCDLPRPGRGAGMSGMGVGMNAFPSSAGPLVGAKAFMQSFLHEVNPVQSAIDYLLQLSANNPYWFHQPATASFGMRGPSMNGMGYGSGAGAGNKRRRGPPVAGVDGNWLCNECQNVNFASREKCNKCQAAKQE